LQRLMRFFTSDDQTQSEVKAPHKPRFTPARGKPIAAKVHVAAAKPALAGKKRVSTTTAEEWDQF